MATYRVTYEQTEVRTRWVEADSEAQVREKFDSGDVWYEQAWADEFTEIVGDEKITHVKQVEDD